MKTRTAMMVVIVLMAIQFTMAEEPAKKFATVEQKIAFAKKNLLAALHSTNKGVIAASMRLSAQIKMRYSAEDVSELVEVMDELWQKHPEGKVRYKAYIAKSICENPDWYSNNTTLAAAGDDTFFYIASDQMRNQLLSANAK
jgi:hypothetical protein